MFEEEFIKWFIKEFDIQYNEVLLFVDEWIWKTFVKISSDIKWFPTKTFAEWYWHIWIKKFVKKRYFFIKPLIINIIWSVYLWEWRLEWEKRQSLEDLDINEMQNIVTNALKNKSCIVIDDVSEILQSIKYLKK